MSVVFEFEAGKDFHFAAAFASAFNIQTNNNRVVLPEAMGAGFIQEIYLPNGLSLCFHNYTLRQELILMRQAAHSPDVLTIKFDGGRSPLALNSRQDDHSFAANNAGGVEFGTSNFFIELKIDVNKPVLFLVIVSTREALTKLLQLGNEENAIRQTLVSSTSFVLHEDMTLEMERILKLLSLVDENTRLATLFYQTKAQELIFLLFSRLLKRSGNESIAVNTADAEKIYALREAMLKDLSIPPQLPEMARSIGMSLTKMKQLFNQVFGKSIYNYYQAARMNKAAQLLASLSVSEVGYHVGFTNLSHFTRLFEKHYQMKPKHFKNALK